jgi:hypothetical protein
MPTMSRAVPWLIALVLVSGCSPTYALECAGPDEGLTPEECEIVAAKVVATKPAAVGHQLGELVTVSVELIECTTLKARRHFVTELAEPTADRCWAVGLSYAGGDLMRVAIRHFPTGEVNVH